MLGQVFAENNSINKSYKRKVLRFRTRLTGRYLSLTEDEEFVTRSPIICFVCACFVLHDIPVLEVSDSQTNLCHRSEKQRPPEWMVE